MSAETKRCSWCGQTKPLSDFGRKPEARDGLKSNCRPCSTEAVRRSRQRHGYDRDRARNRVGHRARLVGAHRYGGVGMTVSAVAIDSAGLVAAVCPLDRERTIAEVQAWADRQQEAGYRVAALPFVPQEGVVVAEALREEVAT